MQKYKYADVLALAEAAIAERGADFIYSENFHSSGSTAPCKYFVNGEPACIVGLALTNAGILTKAVGEAADEADVHAIGLIDSYIGRYRFTDKAATFLSNLQAYQDNGYSWGESLYLAKANVAGMVESTPIGS